MRGNRPAAILLIAMLLLSVAVVVTELLVSTDMQAFLPSGGEPEEQLLIGQLGRGPGARVMLLAIESDEGRQAARLSIDLATELRRSGRFERVYNGGLSLSESAEAPWFEYRYLLQSNELSAAEIKRELQQRLQELRTPLGLYTRQTLAEDPTAAYRQLLTQSRAGTAPPQTRHGVWFDDAGRAILLAETRAPGFALDVQQQTIAAVQVAFERLAQGAQAELVISGAPAIAVASRETIRSEAQWASIGATLAVALILLLAYRSLRLWLLSILPLASAMLVALAVTTLLFGSVHGITIAFGITLLGVAIDYPIHLFSHLAPGHSPGDALRRVWPTMRLGVVSTATGFAALWFTRFEGLLQLGVFAVSGLLAAALVTRFLLVPLLPSSWNGRESGLCPAGVGNRYGTLLAAIVAMASLLYLAQSDRPLWESDLAALSPIPESVRQQERALRDALPVAELNRLLLMRANDLESLLQAQERLLPLLRQWQGEGLLSGYILAAQRLPSTQTQRARQQALPETTLLQRRLQQAGAGLPFRSDYFAPFIEAVEQSRQLPPLELSQVQGTALGAPLANLLYQRDGQWWGVVRLAGVESVPLLQQRLEQAPMALRYVDLKAVTGGMLDGFRDTALSNLAWGLLVILLVIALSVRSLQRLLRVALPLAGAVALTVALLHGLGERLTLFHLTSLLLVIGIGIDYSLFFSRRDPAVERARTAHALGVCAISTATVFAILAFSRLPVLHAIGITVLIGVVAAYVLARLAGGGVMEDSASGEAD